MSENDRTQWIPNAKKTEAPERRARIRYVKRRETAGPGSERGGVEACWGKVHDLSSHGISLGLSWHVPPGTRLTIDKLGGLAMPLRARVIHTTKDVAGGWLASCKFILPLSREELHALGQPNELARLQ